MNYKTLKKETKNKFINMCSILFPMYSESNIKINYNGNVIFGKKRFGIFGKVIEKHITDLLFSNIPVQLSILKFGNIGYVQKYQDTISKFLENSMSTEIYSIQIIIDYLYSELFALTPRNFIDDVAELAKLLNINEQNNELGSGIIIENALTVQINEEQYNTERYEEKTQGLTYILDTFICPIPDKIRNLRYKTKKLFVAATILFILCNTIKIDYIFRNTINSFLFNFNTAYINSS